MSARIFILAVIAAATGIAQADFVNAQYTGTQKGLNVRVAGPALIGNTFAGQIKFTLSDGPAAWNGAWITFCTELPQRVNGAPRVYEIVDLDLVPAGSPMGAEKANAILDLCAFVNGGQSLATTSNEQAAAFQLAVWEVVSDFNPALPGFNLNINSGAFSAGKTTGAGFDAPLTAELNNLFSSIGRMNRGGVEVAGLRSGQYQDQLVTTVVPAPGPAALAGLASLLVASRRRAR